MTNHKIFSVCLILAVFQAKSALSCTTFAMPQSKEKIVGKSFDWHLGHGFAMVNKRGVSKKALALNSEDNPAEWVSKFGSVTFNVLGRDLPMGGVNEAGLVVEIMNNEEELTPLEDRPTVNELQWIQYQLDRYSSVKEVVENVKALSISKVMADVHYMACDAQGECATLEFTSNQSVVHWGDSMPKKVLTNDPYEDLLKYYEKTSGQSDSFDDSGSEDRFVKAARMSQQYDPQKESPTAAEYAFKILDEVKQGSYTKWNIVYDLKNKVIQFRTRLVPKIRTLQMSSLDFSCRTPVLVLDLNQKFEGDVTNQLSPYTPAVNERLSELSEEFERLAMSPEQIKLLRDFPETTACVN